MSYANPKLYTLYTAYISLFVSRLDVIQELGVGLSSVIRSVNLCLVATYLESLNLQSVPVERGGLIFCKETQEMLSFVRRNSNLVLLCRLRLCFQIHHFCLNCLEIYHRFPPNVHSHYSRPTYFLYGRSRVRVCPWTVDTEMFMYFLERRYCRKICFFGRIDLRLNSFLKLTATSVFYSKETLVGTHSY